MYACLLLHDELNIATGIS